MWAGSRNGLMRFRNGRIDAVDRDHGLPGHTVTGITGDEQRELWLGVSAGIARIRPDTISIKRRRRCGEVASAHHLRRVGRSARRPVSADRPGRGAWRRRAIVVPDERWRGRRVAREPPEEPRGPAGRHRDRGGGSSVRWRSMAPPPAASHREPAYRLRRLELRRAREGAIHLSDGGLRHGLGGCGHAPPGFLHESAARGLSIPGESEQRRRTERAGGRLGLHARPGLLSDAMVCGRCWPSWR